MLSKIITFSLIIMLSISLPSYADKVKSISDMLNSSSFDMFNLSRESIDAKMLSCESDGTTVVTIYSTTGKAQVGIDVKIDGSPVGSLTTHFPDKGPKCKTPGSEGIITIVIPAGKHTLEAESLNLVWPAHSFTINKCECLVVPLS